MAGKVLKPRTRIFKGPTVLYRADCCAPRALEVGGTGLAYTFEKKQTSKQVREENARKLLAYENVIIVSGHRFSALRQLHESLIKMRQDAQTELERLGLEALERVCRRGMQGLPVE